MALNQSTTFLMIDVGKLVADKLVTKQRSTLISPFRFVRFKEGDLHSTSSSSFPRQQ